MRPSHLEIYEKRKNFLLYQWIKNKIKGLSIGDHLYNKGIRTVIIYGAGDLGELLYEELKISELTVKYFVDRNADKYREKNLATTEIYRWENKPMEKVDAIIISILADDNEITQMCNKDVKEVYSLEELVYKIGEEAWKN